MGRFFVCLLLQDLVQTSEACFAADNSRSAKGTKCSRNFSVGTICLVNHKFYFFIGLGFGKPKIKISGSENAMRACGGGNGSNCKVVSVPKNNFKCDNLIWLVHKCKNLPQKTPNKIVAPSPGPLVASKPVVTLKKHTLPKDPTNSCVMGTAVTNTAS